MGEKGNEPRQTGAACALPPDQLTDRISQWKELAAQALARQGEPGRVLSTYPRTDAIAGSLRTLIEAEGACCPFLAFEVREGDDAIEVELRYPPEFGPMLSAVIG